MPERTEVASLLGSTIDHYSFVDTNDTLEREQWSKKKKASLSCHTSSSSSDSDTRTKMVNSQSVNILNLPYKAKVQDSKPSGGVCVPDTIEPRINNMQYFLENEVTTTATKDANTCGTGLCAQMSKDTPSLPDCFNPDDFFASPKSSPPCSSSRFLDLSFDEALVSDSSAGEVRGKI